MRKTSYILRALRSPRKILQSLTYVVNDELYWDAYVQDWRRSNDGTSVLGTEWKHEEAFLKTLAKYASPEQTALEIGCGGGRITSKARKLFKHIYATDVSKEMLKQSKKSVPDANVSYHKLDGFTLSEFADDSIDLVHSHDVFVHFSFHQVYTYFQEIKRVLKNNGLCIVSFYDFKTSYPLFKEMSQKFYDQRRFPPHMRVHFVTKEAVSSILKDLQLKLVESRTKDFLVVVCRKMLNGT